MKNIISRIKNIKKTIWILLAIILVGIFLRTYNFRDWLVFNPDQARDAMLIESALKNPANFPLLGPEAGNTHFSLGPIFYWFEYVSAKIFGNKPEAMAYPDLIFSILTIPLFYFFAKKYFSVNISLALTTIFSVSFFAVRYSRFAMNTNSIPFFTLLFLFGILGALNEKNKKSLIFPTLIGIGLGVGIQLHALLLIVMPLLALIALIFLIKRKLFTWKKLFTVILLILVLNIGQIIYDIQNKGLNSHLFLSSVNKSSEKDTLLRNLGMDLAYQFQANMHMLSSLGNQNDANFIKITNKIIKNKTSYLTFKSKLLPSIGMIFSLFFSIGGYLLLGYFFKKEKDRNKKDFLLMIFAYSLIMFFVMLPIIQEASIRYFIVLLFLPFIFLGLWMNFLLEKNKIIGLIFSIIITALLLFSNFHALGTTAGEYRSGSVNNINNSVLGENETMLNYIIDNSDSSKEIYLTGKNLYLIRFYKPLLYLAEKRGVNIIRIFSDKEMQPKIPLFYIQDTKEKSLAPGELYNGHVIKSVKKYKNIMIFRFEN